MTPSMFLSRMDLIPSSRSLWISASSLFLFASTVIGSSWEDAWYVEIRGSPALECIDERGQLVAASRNAPLFLFSLERSNSTARWRHSCRSSLSATGLLLVDLHVKDDQPHAA